MIYDEALCAYIVHIIYHTGEECSFYDSYGHDITAIPTAYYHIIDIGKH